MIAKPPKLPSPLPARTVALYPLKFRPIYQYRSWGGRRLAAALSAPLPADGLVGEAWVLSDRPEKRSLVSEGPLEGKSLAELIALAPGPMLGPLAGRITRFPLLLKFLDARKALSVQVHPSDSRASLLPPGETGKTEAWVILETGPSARIWAGLKPGVTAACLRDAIADGSVADQLSSFEPNPGEAVLLEAGAVHSLRDAVVFEVQENSDVTFRLFDWNHLDPLTGQPRPLQVEQALQCLDYTAGPVFPSLPEPPAVLPGHPQRLLHCRHFGLSRLQATEPFSVGVPGAARVLVCLAGEGLLRHGAADYPFHQGEVVLLPAAVGAAACQPHGSVTLLEVSLPAPLPVP